MTDTNTNSENEVNEPVAEGSPQDSHANGNETVDGAPSAEALVTEWKTKAAYFAAEMENMKKRFIREKSEVIKMANEDLIRTILPVFDNLDLALKSIRDLEQNKDDSLQSNKVFGNLLKGVEMTLSHFQQTLERVGVQKIDSVGTPFDPSLHEAMGQSSDSQIKNEFVSSEFQKGFLLHGRVIRTAKVIVNKISNIE